MKNTDLLPNVKPAPAKATSIWGLPGADAVLARFWRSGMPIRRIGIEMSELMGRHVSHNACVARAHRIDLGPHPAGRHGVEHWKHKNSNTRKARKVLRARSGAKAKPALAKIKAEPLPPPQVEDVARVQLVDLERGMCHWPVGDPKKPGFGYCGCDTGSKSMDYCAGHHTRAYVRIRGE